MLSLFFVPSVAQADIGLVAFDSTGSEIQTSNAGRSGIYLSNVCSGDRPNQFRLCTGDDYLAKTNGVVFQRFEKVSTGSDTQWIGVPAREAFYGKQDLGDTPILETKKSLHLIQQDYYEKEKLGTLLNPDDQPLADGIVGGSWKSAIDTAAIKSAHIFKLKTDSDQDQKVIDWLNQGGEFGKFSEAFNNCSNFANKLFQLAYGKDFNGKGGIEEARLTTPTSMAKEVKRFAKENELDYTVTQIDQTPGILAKSKQPTELIESNLGAALTFPLRYTPVGFFWTGFKAARKYFGLPVPGMRDHISFDKEVKTHGDNELAELSDELGDAKKDPDKLEAKDEIKSIKLEIKDYQDVKFGSKPCWKDQRAKFEGIISRAVDRGVIDPSLKKYFKDQNPFKHALELIPYLHLDVTPKKLIKTIVESDSTGEVDRGLSRNRIGELDPALGFKVMAAILDSYFQADRSRRPVSGKFDRDWTIFIGLAKKLGLAIESRDEVLLRSCDMSRVQLEHCPDALPEIFEKTINSIDNTIPALEESL